MLVYSLSLIFFCRWAFQYPENCGGINTSAFYSDMTRGVHNPAAPRRDQAKRELVVSDKMQLRLSLWCQVQRPVRHTRRLSYIYSI